MTQQLIFWGVKGSCAGASPGAYAYSVNTSCVEISNDEELIILDGGSGIVFLGQSNRDFSRYKRISLFITHYHYDHIMGLPFFKPFYQSDLEFHIYGPVYGGHGPESAVKGLFTQPYLPMGFEALQAKIHFYPLHTADFVSLLFGEVKTHSTDHPGGNLAYKVTFKDKTFVYLTDLGHDFAQNEGLVQFCSEAQWLYYDANFTQSEYFHSKYEGWGHSTHAKGVALFDEVQAEMLFLGHHALHRTDEELKELEDSYGSERIRLVRDGDQLNW